MANKLILLFGLSGSGKNFVGKILSKKYGWFFWDADTLLPEDMKHSIKKEHSFTQAQRDNFTLIMIEQINKLRQQYENLIVGQGLYKEKNRQAIHDAFPDAKLIQIKATTKNIFKRLHKRNDHISKAYGEKISAHFEEPRLLHGVITNDTDSKAIEAEANVLFEQLYTEDEKPLSKKMK